MAVRLSTTETSLRELIWISSVEALAPSTTQNSEGP